MKCKKCGSEMTRDTRDFRFKGCYDDYMGCTFCHTSVIVEVRYGQPYQEFWHSENDSVEDWVIKHNIKFS